MVQVIDLTSSPPPEAATAWPPQGPGSSSTMAGKRVSINTIASDESSDVESEEEEEEEEESEPLAVPVPTVEELVLRYPDRAELYSHLLTLPRPLLSTMLMAHLPDPKSGPPQRGPRSTSVPLSRLVSKPPPPKAAALSNLAHCVYCHKIYDTKNNEQGCVIKHWGDFDDEGFTCCGIYVYWESDNDARPPPEVEEPYCYQGPHHDRLILNDDDDGTTWWRDWKDGGETCDDKNCENELKRFLGAEVRSGKRPRR